MKNLGKLFGKMLGLVFASAILFIGVACENDSSSNGSGGTTDPVTPTLTGIEVTGGTREFGAGNTLAIGTLTVKKVMSDGTKVDLESTDYTVVVKNAGGTAVAEGDMLYEGTYTVTVTLNADPTKTATYTITVGPAVLSEITIKTQPNNTGKFVGDALNKVGLEITATYSDNRTKELDAESEGVTVSPETLTSTSNTITVTYNDGTTTKEATFTVSATAVVIDSIEVTTNPKTSYMGEDKAIDLTGMVVTATKNNGTTEPLADNKYTTNKDSISFTTDGDYDLVVTYAPSITDTVKLHYSQEVITLKSIAITTEPTKKNYFVGDTLDLTGMVVKATYTKSSDNTDLDPREVSIALSDVAADMSKTDTTKATVTYRDGSETATATFDITVTAIALSSISIATEPAKKDYIVGETVDLTGIVVNAVYNDTRKNKTLGASDVTTTTALNTAGTTVPVSVSYTDDYGTATTTYNVAVADKPTFTVTVVGDPDIEITKTGTTLTANLNGIKETATYQWSVDGVVDTSATTNTYSVPTLATGEVRIVTLIVTVDGIKYSANITLK